MVNLERRRHIYFESGRRLREEKLRNGILSLTSQGLNGDDLKQILINLNPHLPTNADEPAGKRRRVEGKEGFIARLSSCSHIVEVDLSYNQRLGAFGMDHIHLLPPQVHSLNLNNCGLSVDGFRKICKLMETNTTITQFRLCDTYMNNDKAECVGTMLAKNSTLKELSISINCLMGLGKEGCKFLGDGLRQNKRLKRLGYFQKEDHEALLYFASVLMDGGGSELQTFRILTNSFSDASAFERVVIPKWTTVLQKCENLVDLGVDHNGLWGKEISFWLELNSFQARQVTRAGKSKELADTLEKASRRKRVDVVYFLIQNNCRLFGS
ncbi:unnamed protein product [Cylindrotheca closterium]|uniref:Uncharacterized protein n=1 Tax=Cylindrotheca closterium TaxID=2856 RepID=A0AAD2D109_9STRA|nr:unnamed protein product [Cylindrotheca closterium]